MTLIEPLEFRRVHLAILFGCGIVFKGLWKHLTGSHLIVFTVCVGGLYLAKLMKPKDALDEEIEKLDAALTSSDGDDVRTYVRPTKFIVPEAERGLFTQRQYSSLLGGTQAQRRKFLRKKPQIEDKNDHSFDGNPAPSSIAMNSAPTSEETVDTAVPEASATDTTSSTTTHRRRRSTRAPLDQS
ncbi:hypothetical protein DYB25_001104 [Aphanomyces astaci]|uniref:Uncharacterized protein n=1 Tax=Aphanomyces astaci TaxID=112090 RepID=A0A397FYT2_APHAT|nr:hypothetical protein DYB25_001104 [Aphanomyces astaci]RHY17095.1 hypothetical protein DYB36_005844 [Aphanomyces astaci]RHY69959.1 hypothetical protein DYB38_002703 [Aphanomyces astaci]RHY70259.1 hypothetical protein DYB34_003474 [Aphanomyces astaci]RHY71990.1 hypothetical protein DYB30_004368 [Aphanomyces astaci]